MVVLMVHDFYTISMIVSIVPPLHNSLNQPVSQEK